MDLLVRHGADGMSDEGATGSGATTKQKFSSSQGKASQARDKTGDLAQGQQSQGCPLGNKAATVKITLKVDAPNFVPKLAGDELRVQYLIEGDHTTVASLGLRVAPKGHLGPDQAASVVPDGAAKPSLTLKPDKASDWVGWDGSVAAGWLPGTVVLERSPYVLRWLAALTSGDKCESNTAEVAVLFDSVDIRVEDPSGTPSAPVKDLVQGLDESEKSGDSPPQGALYVDSAVFKVASSEMSTRASYVQYEKHYDTCKDDLRVPFLARVWLKGKDGKSKKQSPEALTGSMVLWDFRYLNAFPLRGKIDSADQMDFHGNVWGHKKDQTQPAGFGCHKVLGGPRGTSRRMWQSLKHAWGFLKAGSRAWAGYTRPGHVDGVDADSGVWFDPGRMAGDVFTVTAFLDTSGELYDTPDEGKPYADAGAHKSDALRIELRRRIKVADNLKIGATAAGLDVAGLNDRYGLVPARFEPADPARSGTGDWLAAYTKALGHFTAGSRDGFVALAAEPDPGGWPVKFRSYADYKAQMRRKTPFAGFLRRVRDLFGVTSERDYRAECDANACSIVSRTLIELGLTKDGLTLLRFEHDGRHNMPPGPGAVLGWGPSVPGCTGRNRAVALMFCRAAADAGLVRKILVHEVGHALFLAHAPGLGSTEGEPAGCQPGAHWDKGPAEPELHCVMSYHDKAEHLCGLCLVKLAGADYTKVKSDGTVDG
jgi:hypothetical protein